MTPRAEPERAGRPWPKVGLLRRAGPVVLIVAALVAAGVSATMHENKGTTGGGTPGAGGAAQIGHSTVPLTYAAAAKVGKTAAYNWGPECDHHTGRLKIPSAYSPPCVPVPAAGTSNGDATSSGVTASAINVVYYQAQPGGLASTISSAAGTNAQALATAEAYVAMFNKVYELYGRHINLIPFTASGADADPVAAHADAVTVAQQLHAFASINGPGETNAYQDELARLHVLCMACGDSVDQRADPAERPLPVGQPPDGRHLALRDGRVPARQAERQGRHLGRRAVLPHGEAPVHRRERDIGAARPRARGAHGVADEEAGGGPRQHGLAERRCRTPST